MGGFKTLFYVYFNAPLADLRFLKPVECPCPHVFSLIVKTSRRLVVSSTVPPPGDPGVPPGEVPLSCGQPRPAQLQPKLASPHAVAWTQGDNSCPFIHLLEAYKQHTQSDNECVTNFYV